ncbi:MAG: hypothetical protein RLZZ420_2012 [Bacteroidota bacterium]|jgi:hypothetical protein
MYRFLIFLLLISSTTLAQKLSRKDKKVIGYLETEVSYLASNDLKGRRAGDEGEILAANFIAGKFKEIGLLPKGNVYNTSFFQPFDIYDGKFIDSTSFFLVNGVKAEVGRDIFPLSNSPKAVFKSNITPAIHESGQPWLYDLGEELIENKDNPHFDIQNLVLEKLKSAKAKNVPYIIFYNSSPLKDNITFDPKDRSETALIPAFYLTAKSKVFLFPDSESEYGIDLNISISPRYRNARNVVGYIDNKSELTVVIGAHFDHLGYGEDGNSMIRGAAPDIHNGADDNASGTASLIELAFALKGGKAKQYNFLFIAFSAEELGLNGSKFFVENPTIDLKSVNYMINMDMVGRMNDSTKTITVGGYGTSSSWNKMISAVDSKDFSIKADSSGSGPSDHTSFYRKDIPVLFFFTGLHSDYHKPSDDADKINYTGIFKIIRFIEMLILKDKSGARIDFLKTREQQTSTSTRFSVSMGIMPDYSYSGNGVRVDGVSDNRPAKKVGILAGDIVKQLGDIKTSSVESYMQALSKFKKGDSTTVIILRKDQEIKFEITF